jgi:hypothetical protein
MFLDPGQESEGCGAGIYGERHWSRGKKQSLLTIYIPIFIVFFVTFQSSFEDGGNNANLVLLNFSTGGSFCLDLKIFLTQTEVRILLFQKYRRERHFPKKLKMP